MTRTGRIAMVVVTSFAANIAFVIVQGGGLDDGYGRLFLVMLAIVYVPIALLILIFDRAWRSARTRQLSYRNLPDLERTDNPDSLTGRPIAPTVRSNRPNSPERSDP